MLEIQRMTPRVGAIATGVDIRVLDEATFEELYKAWLDCNVLVVRDQDLQMDEFLAYSRRFGLVEPHPSKSTRHPDCPEITLLGVNKFGSDGKLDMNVYRRGGHTWHTDGAYDQMPFKATQLHAVAVPSRGGNTMFASMYAAYEALPDALKKSIENRLGAFVYDGRSRMPCSIPQIATRRQRYIRWCGRTPRPVARLYASSLAKSCTSKGSATRKAMYSSIY